MSRVCEICGKGRTIGNSVETRGKAKYLGGVGTKITGITRRQFLPNLQNVKASLPSGETKTVKVCVQCIRSGAVRKQVKNTPFKLIHDLDTTTSKNTKRKNNKRVKKQ
ncbi:MAG: 50S ribosomal protein L28 [Planctomycetaceae bacterium]|jgi:large subunit ribosomal protein L28|nr:50S ribosomal protein L28 [Planctomycetaceae bacterium]